MRRQGFRVPSSTLAASTALCMARHRVQRGQIPGSMGDMPMDAHQPRRCYASKLDSMVLAQSRSTPPPTRLRKHAIPFVASNALWTLASEELYGRYTHGDLWGGGVCSPNQTSSAPPDDRTDRCTSLAWGLDGRGSSNLVANPDPAVERRVLHHHAVESDSGDERQNIRTSTQVG
jgi:hypothetical protein